MLKKNITYTDFDDNEVTEEFHFHLTQAELVEMELSTEGGLREHLERISKANDGAAIMEAMKSIILKSCGQRVGGKFVKSEGIRDSFAASEAYSTLFLELVTNAEAAAEFMNGLVSKQLEGEIAKIAARMDAEREHPSDTAATPASPGILTETEDPTAIEPLSPEGRVLTRKDQTEMTTDEIKQALNSGAVLEQDQVGTQELNPSPRVISLAEASQMDQVVLKNQIASGEVVLG